VLLYFEIRGLNVSKLEFDVAKHRPLKITIGKETGGLRLTVIFEDYSEIIMLI
jgi:hypothetical protein